MSEVEDRLIKAQIGVQKKNPFFAYLSLYIKFKEDKQDKIPEWAGMGVDIKGNLIYKKQFVEKLRDKELMAVLTHEILHLSLLHLLRRKDRNPLRWNIATDVVVNQIVKDNGFSLPKGAVVSNDDNEVDIFGQRIKDCHKKTAEEVYNEIKIPPQNDEDKIQDTGGFDVHYEGEEISREEKQELEAEWANRVEEAVAVSRMKGNVPAGIEELVGELHKEKIDWKSLLYRFITKQIPYNSSWNRPSKKSVAIGQYLPNQLKEKIDMVVAVDLSGSIGKEELNDFISEVVGIAKAFQRRINMRIVTHDVEVADDYTVENGNIEKIKNLKLHGGGGTSHNPVFDYIQDNIKQCKCTIFFTDGFSDINNINFEEYSFNKVFVISEDGDDNQVRDKNCEVINLGKV